jgi:hypothetical protein
VKKRTKVLLLWISLSVSALMVSIVGIAALVANGLLDETPFPLSKRTPDGKALGAAIKKLDTFSKTKKGKKRDWGNILSQFLLNPVQSVTLNKKEVNALIDAGLVESHANTSARKKQPEVILADASFNGDFFLLKISKNIKKDIKRDTPFGHFINISMEFWVEVVDNHFHLKVRSLKVGAFPIPERFYTDGLNQQLNILEKGHDGRRFLKIIRSLKIENDKVALKYNAKELMLFLMEKLPGLMH